MLLLSKPPLLRWAAAVIVVLAAIAWDLSGRATEPFPFAAEPIDRGTPITEELIEWRRVGRGDLAVPTLEGRRAAVDIATGDPITASTLETPDLVPDDWWSVPMEVPIGLSEGTAVRLLLPAGAFVDGIVTAAPTDDAFGGTVGAVAVASEHLEAVAAAASAGLVMIVISP